MTKTRAPWPPLLCLLCALSLLMPQAQAEAPLRILPDGDYLYYSAGEGESVYLYTGADQLYRWQASTRALERLPMRMNTQGNADTITAIALIRGRVYAKPYEVPELRLIYEEEPGGQEVIPLNIGKSYAVRSQAKGDELWLMVDRSGNEQYVLHRLDVTTGKLTRFDASKGLYQYALLPDEGVLLLDNLYVKGRQFARFRMLDLKTEKARELLELPEPVGTPAYDPESGMLYYVSEGALWRWPLKGQPEKLIQVPVGNEHDHNAAQAIRGKVALPYSGGVFLVDPEAQHQASLHVLNDGTFNHYSGGYKRFLAKHPEVLLSNGRAENKEDFGTGDLAQRIRMGDLAYDVMQLSTRSYDLRLLIDKGYCADLSDDPELVALVRRMYPAIASQAIVDGKLYALPIAVRSIEPLNINPYGLERTRLTREQLPTSFEGLIDLVGGWRQQAGSGDEVPRPFETSDAGRVLKQFAIQRYIFRLMNRGEPLRFNDPAFVQLLQRIENQRLPAFPEAPFVFDPGQEWLPNGQAISLSLFEGEEKLQAGSLEVYIVNSQSKNQALARDYLRTAAAALRPEGKSTLLADWREPIERADYAQKLSEWQAQEKALAEAVAQAAQGSAERRNAQEKLDAHRATQDKLEAWHYLVSPEDLNHYQQEIAPYLFFPAPSVFTDWSQPTAVLLNKEIRRYLDGHMSAEQLSASLDQMARLMELENR